jgi:hypothetical protein
MCIIYVLYSTVWTIQLIFTYGKAFEQALIERKQKTGRSQKADHFFGF